MFKKSHMIKKLAIIFAAITLSASVLAGGTQGHAIPDSFDLTPDSQHIAVVFILVTAGWLNTPHSISITITSVNGDPDQYFFHGTQVHALDELTTFGGINQGDVIVVVPWDDQHDRENHSTYTLCAHVIFADSYHGSEVCETFL